MITRLFLALFIYLLATGSAWAGLDFSVHKLGMGAPVALIIGGIQGDEPGGFSAASLLITSYKITKGAVLVVPNLNFPSIIQRSRGIYGDMNRKFAVLDNKDPEYSIVSRIKELICTPGLNLVLNLHDGWGFYSPTRQSKERNPDRWGHCVVIDMGTMEHPQGDLERRAKSALKEVNQHLLRPSHSLYIKNTLTNLGNTEMEKTLSWFAVQKGIPAFGIESSKNFNVETRTYYHLRVIESLLKQLGIEFERDFNLNPKSIAKELQTDLQVTFADNRILLNLENVRPRLGGSIPMPKNYLDTVQTSKPILAITQAKNELHIHYGNRTLTTFKADWRETDHGLESMQVVVDGKPQQVKFGDIIDVNTNFKVEPITGYRVNAIGASMGADESGVNLILKNFQDSYSLDTNSSIYRVETYKGKNFAGMFLVRFKKKLGKKSPDLLPAIAGKETQMGK